MLLKTSFRKCVNNKYMLLVSSLTATGVTKLYFLSPKLNPFDFYVI